MNTDNQSTNGDLDDDDFLELVCARACVGVDVCGESIVVALCSFVVDHKWWFDGSIYEHPRPSSTLELIAPC